MTDPTPPQDLPPPPSKQQVYFEPIGARHLSQIQSLYAAFHLEALAQNPFESFDDRPGAASHISRSLRQLRQRLMTEERYLGYIAFVASAADDPPPDPIAYIAGVIEQLPSMYRLAHHGSITELFVIPPLRHLGIGSKLLSLLCDAFQAAGLPCADIQISHTVPPSDKPLQWLEKRGFSTISTKLLKHF